MPFKQVYEKKKILCGHSNDIVCLACLFMACRQEGVPRIFTEINAVASAKEGHRQGIQKDSQEPGEECHACVSGGLYVSVLHQSQSQYKSAIDGQ